MVAVGVVAGWWGQAGALGLPAATAAGLPGIDTPPLPRLQVRDGDWITADGTTLGSDNGGPGLAGGSCRKPACLSIFHHLHTP